MVACATLGYGFKGCQAAKRERELLEAIIDLEVECRSTSGLLPPVKGE